MFSKNSSSLHPSFMAYFYAGIKQPELDRKTDRWNDETRICIYEEHKECHWENMILTVWRRRDSDRQEITFKILSPQINVEPEGQIGSPAEPENERNTRDLQELQLLMVSRLPTIFATPAQLWNLSTIKECKIMTNNM